MQKRTARIKQSQFQFLRWEDKNSDPNDLSDTQD